MFSHPLPSSLAQMHLNQRINFFLSFLGESLPTKGGLCNGYVVLNYRADANGDGQLYTDRLAFLGCAPDAILLRMGTLLATYKKHYAALIFRHQSIRDNYVSLAKDAATKRLRHQEWARSIDRKTKKEIYSHPDGADARYLLLADDLYTFCSALVFAQTPGAWMHKYAMNSYQQMKDLGPVAQVDTDAVLQMIPTDAMMQTGRYGMSLDYLFAFTLTAAEFARVLRQVVRDQDAIQLTLDDFTHTVYLKYTEADHYRMRDSNHAKGWVAVHDEEALILALWKNKKPASTEYFSVALHIYNVTTRQRPSPETVVADLLERRGTDLRLEVVGTRKDTALFVAVKYGAFEIARHLLRLGASPHHQDCDGYSMLGLAVLGGYAELMPLLVKYNANLSWDIYNLAYSYRNESAMDQFLWCKTLLKQADLRGCAAANHLDYLLHSPDRDLHYWLAAPQGLQGTRFAMATQVLLAVRHQQISVLSTLFTTDEEARRFACYFAVAMPLVDVPWCEQLCFLQASSGAVSVNIATVAMMMIQLCRMESLYHWLERQASLLQTHQYQLIFAGIEQRSGMELAPGQPRSVLSVAALYRQYEVVLALLDQVAAVAYRHDDIVNTYLTAQAYQEQDPYRENARQRVLLVLRHRFSHLIHPSLMTEPESYAVLSRKVGLGGQLYSALPSQPDTKVMVALPPTVPAQRFGGGPL